MTDLPLGGDGPGGNPAGRGLACAGTRQPEGAVLSPQRFEVHKESTMRYRAGKRRQLGEGGSVGTARRSREGESPSELLSWRPAAAPLSLKSLSPAFRAASRISS